MALFQRLAGDREGGGGDENAEPTKSEQLRGSNSGSQTLPRPSLDFHPHPLMIVTATPVWRCAVCDEAMDVATLACRCEQCALTLCGTCAEEKNCAIITARHGHYVGFCSDPYSGRGFICSICGLHYMYSTQLYPLHCETCEYDACPMCCEDEGLEFANRPIEARTAARPKGVAGQRIESVKVSYTDPYDVARTHDMRWRPELLRQLRAAVSPTSHFAPDAWIMIQDFLDRVLVIFAERNKDRPVAVEAKQVLDFLRFKGEPTDTVGAYAESMWPERKALRQAQVRFDVEAMKMHLQRLSTMQMTDGGFAALAIALNEMTNQLFLCMPRRASGEVTRRDLELGLVFMRSQIGLEYLGNIRNLVAHFHDTDPDTSRESVMGTQEVETLTELCVCVGGDANGVELANCIQSFMRTSGSLSYCTLLVANLHPFISKVHARVRELIYSWLLLICLRTADIEGDGWKIHFRCRQGLLEQLRRYPVSAASQTAFQDSVVALLQKNIQHVGICRVFTKDLEFLAWSEPVQTVFTLAVKHSALRATFAATLSANEKHPSRRLQYCLDLLLAYSDNDLGAAVNGALTMIHKELMEMINSTANDEGSQHSYAHHARPVIESVMKSIGAHWNKLPVVSVARVLFVDVLGRHTTSRLADALVVELERQNATQRLARLTAVWNTHTPQEYDVLNRLLLTYYMRHVVGKKHSVSNDVDSVGPERLSPEAIQALTAILLPEIPREAALISFRVLIAHYSGKTLDPCLLERATTYSDGQWTKTDKDGQYDWLELQWVACMQLLLWNDEADVALRPAVAATIKRCQLGGSHNPIPGHLIGLCYAAGCGNDALLRVLLESTVSHSDRTAPLPYKLSPLACAISSQSLECVRILLELPAEQTPPHPERLHLAATLGSVSIMSALLESGVAINAATPSALTGAIVTNRVTAVEFLLVRGAKPIEPVAVLEVIEKHGAGTPDCLEVLRLLFDHGLGEEKWQFQTAIETAAQYGHRSVVQYLIDVHRQKPMFRMGDPISAAARSKEPGTLMVLRFLLDSSVPWVYTADDTIAPSPTSEKPHPGSPMVSPLTLAIESGQQDHAMLLIAHGVPINMCLKRVSRSIFTFGLPLALMLIDYGLHVDAKAHAELFKVAVAASTNPDHLRALLVQLGTPAGVDETTCSVDIVDLVRAHPLRDPSQRRHGVTIFPDADVYFPWSERLHPWTPASFRTAIRTLLHLRRGVSSDPDDGNVTLGGLPWELFEFVIDLVYQEVLADRRAAVSNPGERRVTQARHPRWTFKRA